MTLDDAIKLLTENYKIAQKREFIVKPLSWALYHTLDEVDKKRLSDLQKVCKNI